MGQLRIGRQLARNHPAQRGGRARILFGSGDGHRHRIVACARTSTTARRSAPRADRVKVPNEVIDVSGNIHLARRDVLVHTPLAPLPLLCPEPSLVGWHRDLGPKLDYSIVPLNHLDLCAWPIQMMSSPQIGWQHDLAPPAHAHKRPLAHAWDSSGITVIPYYAPSGRARAAHLKK